MLYLVKKNPTIFVNIFNFVKNTCRICDSGVIKCFPSKNLKHIFYNLKTYNF